MASQSWKHCIYIEKLSVRVQQRVCYARSLALNYIIALILGNITSFTKWASITQVKSTSTIRPVGQVNFRYRCNIFFIMYVKTLPRVVAEDDGITVSNNSFAIVALAYKELENSLYR